MQTALSTHYLDIPGGRLAYDDQGAGPLVICAPGLGDLRGEYRFLAPQLVAAGYRVVTMDVRGHGESSARWPDYSVAAVGADMLALARALNAGPASLIGTSMAGGAAVWAAAEAPDAVTRLVLIDAFVRDFGPRWQQPLNRLLYGTLFAGPWGPALWLRYIASLYPTARPDDFTAYSARLRANLREPGRLAALRQMLSASKAASEARLAGVKAPALVIMGTRDRDFKAPEVEARAVAQRLRGQVLMIEGAGHYPHAEMPAQTGAAIVDFLLSGVKVATHGA